MPLPLSLRQPFRQGQINVGVGWRIFAANFNQALAVSQTSTQYGPTIFDLIVNGRFNETQQSSLPTGWIDCGWVDKFKFSPSSKISPIKSGYRMATRALYRSDVDEKCSFVFREQSRTAWKIATGEGVFNLLKSNAAASTVGPLSNTGIAAVPLTSGGYAVSGSVASFIGSPTMFVAAGSGALFPAGTYVVCDIDYNLTSFGLIGDAGVNVYANSTPTDVDFIRKTSDYVATVLAVVPTAIAGQDAIILTAPFFGGGNNPTVGVTPGTGPVYSATSSACSKVQAIQGFTSRGGGTTINEYSMISCITLQDGGQYYLYYPRIAPDQFNGLDEENLPNAQGLKQFTPSVSLQALAYDDPLDGETVVSYRTYIPRSSPSIQIQN